MNNITNEVAHNSAKNTPNASKFNLSKWALEHRALTRYLLVVLMLLGAVAYFQLGQDEDPPFAFRAMAMRVFWPGATAQQVAEQVTSKLEKTLQEVPYADKIRSYSKPGEALITFQVQEAAPPKEIQQTWYTVRKKIADIRGTLPGGVQGPFFNDEFGDVYGSMYALWADGFTHEELKEQVDRVRQRLLKVPHVNKVAIFGAQDEKIFIDISQKRLAQLGLDFNQVLAQLGQQNAVAPTGTVQAPSDLLQVRVTGAFQSMEELSRFAIRSGQTSFKLSDIASVRRAYMDPPVVKLRHQGHESIALGISMAKGGDIISLGKNLKVAIAQIKADLPAGMELRQFQDQSTVVASSVNEFVRTLIEAVVVVLLVSFISLGLHFKPLRLDWRPGMVVAITIPLVMSITFITMYYWGVGLHKISLGSLIIALGLLVDDAIISVEMMVRKIEEGWDATRAATFAYEATAMPMLTGTLITAVGFLPIGMAQSTVGEYTFAIFAVTAAALLISWVVSVYFVPYLGTLLLKVKLRPAGEERPQTCLFVPGPPGEMRKLGSDQAFSHEPHELFDTPFYNRFRSLVRACVRHRWITIALTVGTLVLGIMGMGQVQQQFFPSSSRMEVLVNMWYPEGTSFAANEAVTQRLEARLMKLEGVNHVTTWVGSGAERFALVLDQIFPNTNVSQLIVMAKDLPSRERIRQQLPEILAAEFPEARGRALLLPNGPPVTYPVQFRLEGPDPTQLKVYADQVKAIMRAHPYMQGVNDNWNEAVKSLRLEVDQDKARALGVSSAGIAQAVSIANSGSTIGQYRDSDKLIDIVLRQPVSAQGQLTDLASVYLPTSIGTAVPLSQLAKPRFAWEPGVLWREGRDYAVTVQGDVSEGMQGATLSAQIDPLLDPIRQKMQPGYRIQVAGAVEESSKGQGSIAVGAPLMLFIMFTLLMLQLHSFSRAVLVFLTGPMGIAGVAAALLISGRPFGFVALLGVIALSGMIMRNSVILIDQIEQDRAQGMPAWDAVVEAAVRRFRPILLTAAAAVLAMIPLTRSVFWGPMATAIMGGLVVATFLTLLALPAMYAAWFRIKPPKSAERDKREVLTIQTV